PSVRVASLPSRPGAPQDPDAATRTTLVTVPAAEQPSVEPAAESGTIEVELSFADDGTPVPGAAVLCCRIGTTGASATTDESGVARFTGLKPGSYALCSPDHERLPVDLRAGGAEHLRFELQRGFPLDGVVLDVGGGPVAGAELRVFWAGTEPQWVFPVGRTDRAGRFHLPRCRSGMILFAQHERDGQSDGVLLTTRQHGAATPPSVVLRLSDARTSVRGEVRDETGAPVADAWVQLGGTS